MKSSHSDSQHEVNVAVVLVAVEFVLFSFPVKAVTWFFSLNISAIVLQLFSCSEAVSHDKVVAVLLSYTSAAPGFCGGRFSTYFQLFVLLSLLLELFVLIFLLSWPFEASSSSLLFSPLLLTLSLSFVSIRSLISLFG